MVKAQAVKRTAGIVMDVALFLIQYIESDF